MLTIPEVVALGSLSDEPLAFDDLRARIGMAPGALQGVLDQLEHRGLVTQTPAGWSITKAGRAEVGKSVYREHRPRDKKRRPPGQ